MQTEDHVSSRYYGGEIETFMQATVIKRYIIRMCVEIVQFKNQ